MSSLTLKSRPIVDRRNRIAGASFYGVCPDCGFESAPKPTAGCVHGIEHTCAIPGQLTIDDALAS